MNRLYYGDNLPVLREAIGSRRKKMISRPIVLLLCVLASASAAPGRDQVVGPPERIVYLTEGGSIFHRKDCQTVQAQVLRAFTLSELPAGTVPCSVCKPLDPRFDWPTASARASSEEAGGAPTRNEVARQEFMRQTGYPKGRPGYVIDHIVPLACGGPDLARNMEWQTAAEAKAKDKVERLDCRVYAGKLAAMTPPAPTKMAPRPTPPQADVTVYVTRTGAKYHRAGCSSLSKSAIPMSLRAAVAAGYGPCQRCRPPVLK